MAMQEDVQDFGEAGLQIPTTPTLPSASAKDVPIEDDTEGENQSRRQQERVQTQALLLSCSPAFCRNHQQGGQ